MRPKTSIVGGRQLPLIGRLNTAQEKDGLVLEAEVVARFVEVDSQRHQKFAHMEMLIPSQVFINAVLEGRHQLRISILPGSSPACVETLEAKVYERKDKPTYERKKLLVGYLDIDAFTKRFRGWIPSNIPEQLPVAICVGGDRARSEFYILLAI